MNFICIGDLVNTHGIKGEVRIISDFKNKDLIFVPGKHLYIGKNKEDLVIKTYRTHKSYDMVTFEGINDINDVLMYKGELVYVDKSTLNVDYFEEDLIGLDVYDNDNKIGVVTNLMKNKLYTILVVKYNDKNYLVPNISEFVEKVDLENRKIYINNIRGLIDED